MYPPIRIVIGDSQYLAREGLRAALGNDNGFSVVAEASNIAELLGNMGLYKPNVVIMDYNNPGYFSPDDVVDIKQRFPHAKVLIITADHNKESIFKVLDAGVRDFLTKECGKEEIMEAVRATARNEKFICAKIVDLILERHLNDYQPSQLTEREAEIIPLIANGMSNKEIAAKLHLSFHTVTTHRKNIFRKLGIKSVSELVIYAVRFGFI